MIRVTPRRPYPVKRVRRGIGAINTPERARAYREANPEYTERNRKWNRARNKALGQLAAKHPAEYEILFHRAWKAEKP